MKFGIPVESLEHLPTSLGMQGHTITSNESKVSNNNSSTAREIPTTVTAIVTSTINRSRAHQEPGSDVMYELQYFLGNKLIS